MSHVCRNDGFGAAACLVLLLVSGAVVAKPERIVSMNLCADELVLLLADREHIKSVSWLVTEPGMSTSAERARGIPVNHGLAEEIILMDPDLVVTGRFSNPATNAALRRLGYPVLALELANSIEAIKRQVREVAAALGEPARGAAVVADMEARLTPVTRRERPTAIVYEPNGYVAGVGSLAHEILTAAGLRNLAVELGLTSYSQFPMELLVVHRPDVLVLNRLDATLPAMAEQMLDHPVLGKAFAAARVVSVPRKVWSCGNPVVVDAIEQLRAAADRLVDGE